MDNDDLIKKILFECIAGEGFLAQLRARKFKLRQLNELISALGEYREYIRGNDSIDRGVAYCVFALDNELSGAINYFPRNGNDYSEIAKAIEISTPIIFEILAPEWMTGPLPDEYK